MLATRDQENVVHAHRQAAASKPLNQLAGPKTPGGKGGRDNALGRYTSKKPLNDDENNPFGAGKGKATLGKEKNAFVTPGPRDRAPLGAKTTNAKTKAFQTPAPLTNKQPPRTNLQQRSGSARKPKLKVHHQPEQVIGAGPVTDVPHEAEEEEGNVPDIEYCPTKLPDLSDYPDPDDPLEFKPDEDFSMFSKENYMRDAFQHFHNPIGDDGLRRLERKAMKEYKDDERRFAEIEAEVAANPVESDMEREWRLERELEEAAARSKIADTTRPRRDMSASSLKTEHGPASKLTSKSAADALSSHAAYAPSKLVTSRPVSTSRFAAPTASSAARKPSVVPYTTVHAVKRSTPGTLASKSTLGYASGRKVSASRKQQQTSRGTVSSLNEIDIAFLQRQKEERERSDRLMGELLATEDGESKVDNDVDPLAHLWEGADEALDDQLQDVHLDVAMFAGRT